MHVSGAEKMAMVSLASSDWQQSNNPDNDELFQTLISLIKLGHVVAFYDDNDGAIKYQANSEGQMIFTTIIFIIGLEVGVFIGILYEQHRQREFRQEYLKQVKELG